MRDLIHGSRVDSNSSSLHMGLGTNAIKLIFNQKRLWHGPSYVSEISSRSCQHELDRMEQSHADITKLTCTRPRRSLANIAEQHVCVSNICQRSSEHSRDCILNQTFS